MSLRKDSAPFGSLLVANRGEIAVRIIRACRDLGVRAVAVYSDADTDALHVRMADEAVRIGPAAPAESYLRVDRVVGAAVATGAEAVHPGYGFLSEQAGFAEACGRAGVIFIGPDPGTLAALGDKLAARRAAASAGVPILPGTLEHVPVGPGAIRTVAAQAREIGLPILIKAAAGGGGRGMRRVDDVADLPAALASASREATASFGDGSVYLERYVERARHVEVQLLGDATGAILALGERDCSVQRRHQKLVEEAPAPGLTEATRHELHGRAVSVARTVGLRNAATAEFLLAPDGSTWFLEVNARLQVEHGVTELVSDVDLVREQIVIAAGGRLSAAVRHAGTAAARPSRHAIEVRISAEDPGRGFAPAPGTVRGYREPAGPGVRVDSGVEEGTRVSADYDPLLAKLMVVDSDRDATLARLRRALLEFHVGGLQTTLPFHRWIATFDGFTSGDELSTDMVERCWAPEGARADAAQRAADAAARAWHDSPWLGGQDAGGGAGHHQPRSAPSGWLAQARREGTERWP